MKKAIAMKCTQEDWDSIKGKLDGIYRNIGDFYLHPYIVTDYYDTTKHVTNTGLTSEINKKEEIHETFNAKIFLEACGIEFEKKFEITKNQIIEIASWGNSRDNEKVKEWFPEAFEKELDKNFTGWLKCEEKINADWLMHFENGLQKYGFDASNIWSEIKGKVYLVGDEIEATPQEVETALINEAKKRGYVKGVYFDNSNLNDDDFGSGNIISSYLTFDKVDNGTIWCESETKYNRQLFRKGKWATIIETITIQEAEKLLNKKIV